MIVFIHKGYLVLRIYHHVLRHSLSLSFIMAKIFICQKFNQFWRRLQLFLLRYRTKEGLKASPPSLDKPGIETTAEPALRNKTYNINGPIKPSDLLYIWYQYLETR